jgi:hypothetical protein
VSGDESTVYTNWNLLELFDSSNSDLPYVYDNFEWSHCAERG